MQLRRIPLAILCVASIAARCGAFDPDGGYEEEGGDDPYGGFDPYGMGGMGMDPYGDDMYGMGDMMGGMGGMGGGWPGSPSFETLADLDDVKSFPGRDPLTPALIGFVDGDANAADLSELKRAAVEIGRSDIRVAVVTDVSIMEELKYTSGSRVNAYLAERFVKEGVDRPKTRYPGKHLDSDSLSIWAYKAATPAVGLLTTAATARYSPLNIPEVTLFTKVDLEKNPKGFDYYANRMRKVAEAFGKPNTQLTFNIADSAEMSHRMGLNKITVTDDNAAVLGIRTHNSYYRMEGAFSVEAATQFCRAFLDDTLGAPVHVEIVPEDSEWEEPEEVEEVDVDDSAVVKLTTENFEAEVGDKTVDTMVEFYAPWCGHCQSLKPHYATLAQRAAAEGLPVKIAAMDATTGTPPDSFDVQGYPTLFYVKGGDMAAPMAYDGRRTADAMMEFIKQHQTAAP